MLVLGIESSCDETAAAVIKDGREILSSIIYSQIDIHKEWGGVVPEIASREHLEKIDPVVNEAVQKAGIELKDLDAIAVTQGPGLIGSLLVGVCYAKGLAYGLKIPFIGVNHIEGHFFSVEFDNPPIVYPAMALIVSGGHTNLFYSPEAGKYKIVSRTRDDAAGEAFDKVSKMLGLGYPGGPVIDRLSKEGDPRAIKFPVAKISDGRPDFSFSGLKTAVMRYLRENEIEPLEKDEELTQQIKDICASFQYTVVKSLLKQTERLINEYEPETLIVAGGVACNSALQSASEKLAKKYGLPVYFPSRHLSTDNAAMIAAAGTFHLERGERSEFDMTADTKIRLQNYDLEEKDLRKKKVRYRL